MNRDVDWACVRSRSWGLHMHALGLGRQPYSYHDSPYAKFRIRILVSSTFLAACAIEINHAKRKFVSILTREKRRGTKTVHALFI